MTNISGSGDSAPISPQERKMYEQEYKRGAELFQNALDQYAKSTSIYQKEEFKEVMNKAMDVLNQAASALKKNSLIKQSQQIEQDFAAFEEKEGADTQAKLKSDLDQAKKSIG